MSGTGPRSSAPQAFGDYQVVDLIGRGSMGEVYRCRHPEREGEVAVKLLVSTGAELSETQVSRFQREARICAELNHPAIVHVHEAGADARGLYMVMDLIDGVPLNELTERSPLSLEAALAVAIDIADALAVAHEAGVVHRDIKPQNILVDPGGGGHLLDFGVADLLEEGEELTRTGYVVGTPSYMSPEQIEGENVGPASDVWSLGVVLYEALTGVQPFDADNVLAVATKIQRLEIAPPASHRPLPAGVDEAVVTALDRDLDVRYTDGRALAEALRRVRAAPHQTAQRHEQDARNWRLRAVAIALGAVTLALLLVVAALLATQDSPPRAAPASSQPPR